MRFSFIICTHTPNDEKIDTSIASIKDLQIPEYEIIVVGGTRENKNIPNVTFMDFDESVKGWLTKKKNDAAKISQYEHLCICHDYFAFDRNWYIGWVEKNAHLKGKWEIGSNQIKMINGVRDWADWISLDIPGVKKGSPVDYDDNTKTKNQFIAGHYFLVKQQFFLKNLFDEKLVQAQEEDVEWSCRVRDTARIVFNKDSIVRHLKVHRHLNVWRKKGLE